MSVLLWHAETSGVPSTHQGLDQPQRVEVLLRHACLIVHALQVRPSLHDSPEDEEEGKVQVLNSGLHLLIAQPLLEGWRVLAPDPSPLIQQVVVHQVAGHRGVHA